MPAARGGAHAKTRRKAHGETTGLLDEGVLGQLQSEWAEMCRCGTVLFRDPLLVASAATSLDHLVDTLEAAAARAGIPAAALLPSGGACTLAAALTFPHGGGLSIEPDVALACDFFAVGGPVHAALPDFLGDPKRTGRGSLPRRRLHECFAPAADNWLDFSRQVARLVEQAAWLLLEPVDAEPAEDAPAPEEAAAGDDDAAELEADGRERPQRSRGGTTRRQRKQAVARRREALVAALTSEMRASDPPDGTPSEVTGTSTTASAMETPLGDQSVSHCSRQISSRCSRQISQERAADQGREGIDALDEDDLTAVMEVESNLGNNPQEAGSLSSRSSVASWLHHPGSDPEMALHLCEVNTASWSSRVSHDPYRASLLHDWGGGQHGYPPLAGLAWERGHLDSAARDPDELDGQGGRVAHLRDLNGASFSSRGSVDPATALNMCEINTASWSSRGDRPPWALDQEGGAGHVGWYLREANSSSCSSRDADPMHLCEVNTASWGSAGSRAHAHFAVPRYPSSCHARSIQELMQDLSMHGGAAASSSNASLMGHGVAGYAAPGPTGFGKGADSSDSCESPPLSQVCCGSSGDLPRIPPRVLSAPLDELVALGEDDDDVETAALPAVESFPTFTQLDELLGPEEFRERRHDNLRWRIFAVARRRGTHPITLAAGDAAGGPALPPAAWAKGLSGWMHPIDELHPLCVRETRWENRFMRAARRVADLESGQRVWQHSAQRLQHLWQQSHCGRSPAEHRWHWERKPPPHSGPPRAAHAGPAPRTSHSPTLRSPTLGTGPMAWGPRCSREPSRSDSPSLQRMASPDFGGPAVAGRRPGPFRERSPHTYMTRRARSPCLGTGVPVGGPCLSALPHRESSPCLAVQQPPLSGHVAAPHHGTAAHHGAVGAPQPQPAAVPAVENHVLVAVPMSRLEAVARVLTGSS